MMPDRAKGFLRSKEGMLYEAARHEPLRRLRWDESEAGAAIERIVRDAESRFTEDRYWPLHPLDVQGAHDTKKYETSLYDGACGVFWALDYLESVGAAAPSRRHADGLDRLLGHNRAALGASVERTRASFMLGDTPIQMMSFGEKPTAECERALAALIAGNMEHPARDLMFGSPGTLLAALFLYERTGNERWSDLFRSTAGKLWSQLEWSPQHRCSYWSQELFGRRSTYLDAVHGFVAAGLAADPGGARSGIALPIVCGPDASDGISYSFALTRPLGNLEISMNEETFNLSIRKFLKLVGVNSQREIEQAVDKAIAARTISGTESFPAKVTLEVPGLKLDVKFDGEIRLQ
jgi:Family of unknown function (DUF6494)